jgi:putative methyltransferase (TIGR04325 family)
MLLGATGGARTSVLDIGGGGANAYHHARASARVADLRWTVVERPAVCEAMRRCGVAAEVEFLPSVPPGPFDIVFFGSSLQYFEDWRTALRGAAEASAGFVLLEDVPLVRSPSFVAEQRYFEGVIPVWFLNHEELLGVAAEAALHLVAWDRYRAGILGRWSGFPMDNYPPEMRVGLPSSLLFRVSL